MDDRWSSGNIQDEAFGNCRASRQVIRGFKGGERDAIAPCDFAESLARRDGMQAPTDPFFGWDLADALLELRAHAGGEKQLEIRVARRNGAQKLRIQQAKIVEIDASGIRDETQVDRVAGFYNVHLRRFFRCDVHAVRGGILRDKGERENNRHIVARLLRERVALLHFPEVSVARALDGLNDVAGTGVVSRHDEIPVAEHVVEIAHVLRGSVSGFFRIAALVDVIRAVEAVLAAAKGHELPDAARAGAGW